jgi:hypothetical protein
VRQIFYLAGDLRLVRRLRIKIQPRKDETITKKTQSVAHREREREIERESDREREGGRERERKVLR